MKIEEETAERILHLIRLGHPNEKGEDYHRGDVIQEITRRGIQLVKDLKGLGWTTELKSVYRNRYTGSETTLIEQLKGICDGKFDYHNLFGLLEHYEPIEIWTDKDCFPEYKLKATLNGW